MSTRIAYLVSRFPKVSETFIVDEIHALERRGAEIDLYAFLEGSEDIVQTDSQPLHARAVYAARRPMHWIGSQLRWWFKRPIRSASIWLEVLGSHLASPRALVRASVATAHGMEFARTIQSLNTDHIHAHWATHTATCAWTIHRLTGLPYSFTAHADDVFVERPMLATKARAAAFVVTISEFTQRFLRDKLGATSAPNVQMVHCGLRLAHFEPKPAPSGERFEIACVARLEPKKGHGDLLKACARLRDRGVPFRCRIVGEGRERARIDAEIERLDLAAHIESLGACDRETVFDTIDTCHAIVLPAIVDPEGRADGIPVALIEAQALARPVVATPVSGIPELVRDRVTGLLVPAGDAEALTEALATLHADRALAAELGAAGRQHVLEAFDIDRSAATLLDLMRRAIQVRGDSKAMPEPRDGRIVAREEGAA